MGDRDGGSAYGVAQLQWKWIWKLRVPPKVCNFLWRACHDIIPTRAALFRRRVGSDPFCEFCKTAVETESHVFFNCPLFIRIWAEHPFNLSSPISAPNFVAGLQWVRAHTEDQIFLLAVVTIWNIWSYRNGFYHGSLVEDREGIVNRSKAYLKSYASARIGFPIATPLARTATWEPPQQPCVKIIFDAAILASGDYQIAAVGRDFSGVCVGWSIRRFRGSPEPVVAEACAARLALQLAQRHGWTHPLLEGDCLQVVHALQDNHGERLYSFGSIISACFALFPLFTVLNFSFIRRLGNCLAHALAHFPSLSDSGLDGISLPADLTNVI